MLTRSTGLTSGETHFQIQQLETAKSYKEIEGDFVWCLERDGIWRVSDEAEEEVQSWVLESTVRTVDLGPHSKADGMSPSCSEAYKENNLICDFRRLAAVWTSNRSW